MSRELTHPNRKKSSTVLLIDDEPNVLYALSKSLRDEDFDLVTAASASEAVKQFREHAPDAVLCDIKLPDKSGLDLFTELHSMDQRIPIVMMTAHGTAETAIEAIKRGAFDYLLKPCELDELRETLKKAIESSRLTRIPVIIAEEPAPDTEADRIVGRSAAMQKVYKEIGRVASQDVNVLILGESGTGKELVARAIYRHSARRESPFTALNCAAIPEPILESELFGHEQGAFTGAERRRIGKFEQASGGTLFLDEIGDMSLTTQAKVLRVLQDGTFERVGSNETIQSDVRVIAATNRDLETRIAQQEFREDLFYRLNTFTIHLPPLRDRLDDLPMLIDYFVRLFGSQMNRDVKGVAPEVIESLRAQSWPGNIRELQSSIKYAIVRCTSDILGSKDFPDANIDPPHASHSQILRASNLLAEFAVRSHNGDARSWLHATLDKSLAESALAATDGNHSAAAELLGISRTTFRSILRNSAPDIS